MIETMISKIRLLVEGMLYSLILFIPDELNKFRVSYYNKRGCRLDKAVSISPNVRMKGKVVISEGSSIAQNCSISGGSVGIFIGKHVMVAPGVVIVSFDHGHSDNQVPMVKQRIVEEKIVIEDDVWIAANCTITKGITIGKGAIVAANSAVVHDVPRYAIVGGVPAKIIGTRLLE